MTPSLPLLLRPLLISKATSKNCVLVKGMVQKKKKGNFSLSARPPPPHPSGKIKKKN